MLDSGEAGVANITVYNDANNNSAKDSGELTTVTDSSGNYIFNGLGSGSYKIRQILQSGWSQTSPANGYGWTISLGTDQVLTGKNFGTRNTGRPAAPSDGRKHRRKSLQRCQRQRRDRQRRIGISGITVYNDANNNNAQGRRRTDHHHRRERQLHLQWTRLGQLQDPADPSGRLVADYARQRLWLDDCTCDQPGSDR